MATYVELYSRTISGKGLFKIDELADKQYRHYLLYIDVIRKPRNEYLNFSYNPPQSFYANVLFRKDGYVLETRQIKYPAECWSFQPYTSGQTLLAVKCAYDGILQSFANLAVGLGLTVISVTDLIKDYTSIPLQFDEFAVSCYSTGAIRFRLFGIKYDVCDPEKDKVQPPPTPPPAEPGVIPVDEPIAVSPPYDGDNDGGDTIPSEGDTASDYPFGDACVVYVISFTVTITQDNTQQTGTARVFGEILDVYLQNAPGTSAVIVTCRGNADEPGAECAATPGDYGVFGATEEDFYSDLVVNSIVAE